VGAQTWRANLRVRPVVMSAAVVLVASPGGGTMTEAAIRSAASLRRTTAAQGSAPTRLAAACIPSRGTAAPGLQTMPPLTALIGSA